MERKFPIRNFRKFGYSSRGCHSFTEIPENADIGNFQKFNRNWSNGKLPIFTNCSFQVTSVESPNARCKSFLPLLHFQIFCSLKNFIAI